MIEIYPLPAFTDNYIWVIRHRHQIAVVDPGQSKPVLDHIEEFDLQLSTILITHHHHDHIGGVSDLVHRTQGIVTVYGPDKEAQAVVDQPLSEGQVITLFDGSVTLKVLEIPGHTLGHIGYFWEEATTPWIFCGDTLFSGGCGRIFEGTAQQLYRSLRKIAALPLNTQVGCGHEYTESNLTFAHTVLPDDAAISDYASKVQSMRKQQQSTLPSTLSNELAINIFLRSHEDVVSKAVSAHVGRSVEAGEQTFAALRAWKDAD